MPEIIVESLRESSVPVNVPNSNANSFLHQQTFCTSVSQLPFFKATENKLQDYLWTQVSTPLPHLIYTHIMNLNASLPPHLSGPCSRQAGCSSFYGLASFLEASVGRGEESRAQRSTLPSLILQLCCCAPRRARSILEHPPFSLFGLFFWTHETRSRQIWNN